MAWIFKLGFGTLMEALFFHTERELIFLHHDLVGAKSLVEHLRIYVVGHLMDSLGLLNGALL